MDSDLLPLIAEIRPARLDEATRAYSTRRVPAEAMRCLRTDLPPAAGDLVLARIESLGHHKRLHTVDGGRKDLFVGDLVIVVAESVAAYRIATGELVWKRDGVLGETVVAAHGVVVVAGGGSVIGLGVDDGRVLWHDKSLISGGAIAIEGGPTAQADRR